jgi:hypothetical protein
MSKLKKPDPVADTLKELTPEQVVALEQEKAALVASLLGQSSAPAGAVSVAQDVEPEPSVETPSAGANVDGLLLELKKLQDAKVALQAEQNAKAQELEQAELLLVGQIAQAQSATKRAEADALIGTTGAMVDLLTSADVAHAQHVQASQAEQDERLRAEFAPALARVREVWRAFKKFDKLHAAKLQELAREDEDGFGPEPWDARLRVTYRGKVGLPSRDLLHLMAHRRRELPALLSDLDEFLKVGVQAGDAWTALRAELIWRCAQVNKDTLANLDNDFLVILRAVEGLLKQAQRQTGESAKLVKVSNPDKLKGLSSGGNASAKLVGESDLVKAGTGAQGGEKAVTEWDPFK